MDIDKVFYGEVGRQQVVSMAAGKINYSKDFDCGIMPGVLHHIRTNLKQIFYYLSRYHPKYRDEKYIRNRDQYGRPRAPEFSEHCERLSEDYLAGNSVKIALADGQKHISVAEVCKRTAEANNLDDATAERLAEEALSCFKEAELANDVYR